MYKFPFLLKTRKKKEASPLLEKSHLEKRERWNDSMFLRRDKSKK